MAHLWPTLFLLLIVLATEETTETQQVSHRPAVVVFFTLTDRASTIPSNIRGCQSGMWSAGQKNIRGTSTKLQGEQKKKHKQTKTTRERNKNNKIHSQKNIGERHSIERVWHSASREPSDTLPGSQLCTQTRSIYHIPYSQGFSFH